MVPAVTNGDSAKAMNIIVCPSPLKVCSVDVKEKPFDKKLTGELVAVCSASEPFGLKNFVLFKNLIKIYFFVLY